MDNELIRWQMRKIAYDFQKTHKSIEYADKQYLLLEWFQDAYKRGFLKGNFYTDNIIREIWNRFHLKPSPLQEMDISNEIYESFELFLSGD